MFENASFREFKSYNYVSIVHTIRTFHVVFEFMNKYCRHRFDDDVIITHHSIPVYSTFKTSKNTISIMILKPLGDFNVSCSLSRFSVV